MRIKFVIPGKTYKAILFDVDGKDSSIGMSCPPKAFLSQNVLDMVKTCITDNGKFEEPTLSLKQLCKKKNICLFHRNICTEFSL